MATAFVRASAHWPFWAGLLASAMLFGLLFAFHEVVQGAVRQGDLRRQANAVYADATWRCEALRGAADQRQCLARR